MKYPKTGLEYMPFTNRAGTRTVSVILTEMYLVLDKIYAFNFIIFIQKIEITFNATYLTYKGTLMLNYCRLCLKVRRGAHTLLCTTE